MAAKFGDWQSFLDNAVKVLDCPSRLKAFRRARGLSSYVKFTQSVRPLTDQEWIVDYFQSCRNGKKSIKSAENSVHWRNEGNEYFQKNMNERALECYNKSVIKAPCIQLNRDNKIKTISEPEIALAFANRSAALYHMKKYKHCLEDIRLALAHFYPNRLKYKLFQRQGQCYVALKDNDKAVEAFQEGISVLHHADLNQKKRDLVRGQLQKLMDDSKEQVKTQNLQDSTAKCALPSPLNGYDSVLAQASTTLNLKHTDVKGRHVTANSAIHAGDVLIVERPYAAVLLPSHYSTHCHNCFTKLIACFPCCHCTEVLFCSEACYRTAWESYHQYECAYMDMFHSIGIAHLSMRIILLTGLSSLLDFHDQFISIKDSQTNNTAIDGLTEHGTYERNYLSVYMLMPHHTDMHPEDLFQYAMTAALLLECLDSCGFFKEAVDYKPPEVAKHVPDNQGDHAALVTEIISQLKCHQSLNVAAARKTLNTTDDIKAYVGGLLLRHICQLVCNAHAITELSVTESVKSSFVETTDQVRIATAIYPTASLLNHSCEPSIISSFQNEVLVVRSVKNLKPGDEVFNCYGPHCKRMDRAERQQCLKEQYFFDCICTACESEEAIEDKYKALKCPYCAGPLSKPDVKMKCYDCGRECVATEQMKTVLTSHDMFLDGVSLMKEGKDHEALVKLMNCMRLRESVLYKHNKDLAEVQDAVARCYAILGRFNEAAKVLVDSVKTSSVIYGEKSIELANEQQKYAEVLFHSGQTTESKKIAKKALSIFELNYGSTCQAVKEINELMVMIEEKLKS